MGSQNTGAQVWPKWRYPRLDGHQPGPRPRKKSAGRMQTHVTQVVWEPRELLLKTEKWTWLVSLPLGSVHGLESGRSPGEGRNLTTGINRLLVQNSSIHSISINGCSQVKPQPKDEGKSALPKSRSTRLGRKMSTPQRETRGTPWAMSHKPSGGLWIATT